eukprot:CAMPEP_0196572480 /NCGR_PEP_ID=MMETSP1081-20130531/2533_1 /TAXON_ID=36882 /ORGANISM="Pyramimonas amylifera, Strain CCMP720" /LENGTH=361 /DNA_ID=CAMNT_0041889823 /DNA_START=130 /DNA_END=1215 /DNA_ORIENTATION=-
MQYGEGISFSEGCKQMSVAEEWGVNFFDTAEMYPVPQSAGTQGQSEVCLGRWVRSRSASRDSVVIATKVSGPSAQMPWLRAEEPTTARAIMTAAEASLTRLKTDYIDLLQLHWPDRYVPMFGDVDFDPSYDYSSVVPIEEQLEALGRLRDQGKVREVGLSNETAWGLMSFTKLAGEAGREQAEEEQEKEGRARAKSRANKAMLPKVVSIQNSYSLLCRTFDSTLAEACHREHVSLLAYSPLAMGHLSGKYLPSNQGGPPEARLNRYKGRYAEAESRYSLNRPNLMDAVAKYAEVAGKYEISLVHLATQFVLRNPLLGSAVIGATSLEQLEQILGAAASKPLDDAVVVDIDDVHEHFPNPTP